MTDQVHEHVENLRFDMLHGAAPAEFELLGVDDTVSELVDRKVARYRFSRAGSGADS
jgi:hypothetical protein